MPSQVILASGSKTRATLLQNAGVSFTITLPKIDEEIVKDAFRAEGRTPRDLSDALAEAKAVKVARSHMDAFVIGCDQVLALGHDVISKPSSRADALETLLKLKGHEHVLYSAAAICHEGRPVWRHIGVVKLKMRSVSEDYLNEYVDRNWDSIQHSVGAYKLEEEGVRLFERVQGDYFHVLGLPLLEILSFLVLRGEIEG